MFYADKFPLVTNKLFPTSVYAMFYCLLGMVGIVGLFVPLMNNDSAHHANIALNMYLTHDYVDLVSGGKNYLDKPHLLFWLAALSYKIFGVTGFAYKLPSFLASIFGVYSVFRLGVKLYDHETGRLSALLMASGFAFILAMNDVRMEALLTAFIAFSLWQGVAFIQDEKYSNALGLALGLALGFSTKGHLGVLTPLFGLFFYILYLKKYHLFLNLKWILVLLAFVLFIMPVLYCYYLQYNMHPERIVNGQDHINGVAFILVGQNVERFLGTRADAKPNKDFFFFLHSFLWAFAPWAVLTYTAFINSLRTLSIRKYEWMSISIFIIIALLLSFSASKLPHYLNVVFPAAAVLTAAWICKGRPDSKFMFITQCVVSGIIVLLVLLLNTWFFLVTNFIVIIVAILIGVVAFYFMRNRQYGPRPKAIAISIFAMVFGFFLLNANFYPKLLQYQSGNQLAAITEGEVDPRRVYFWNGLEEFSFNFYTASQWQPFADSVLQKPQPAWLFFDKNDLPAIEKAGYTIGKTYVASHYRVSRLTLPFLNPATRQKKLGIMIIGQVSRR